MNVYRYILFYATTTCILLLAIYWFVLVGNDMGYHGLSNTLLEETNHTGRIPQPIVNTFQSPLSILLLQIVIIIFAARIISWLFRKVGQPVVIGEIIAGILLGPSLLGLYFPEISNFIFPESSLDNLHFVSQIGLVLFMFTVGLELDLRVLRSSAREAIVIGHASAIIPFVSGLFLARFLYQKFIPSDISFISFALFFSISMSVSAFPVLARIAQERAIHKTKTGTIVMACAASNDLLVWSLLAIIISIIRSGSFMSASYTMVYGIAFIFLMFKIIRPFLERVGELHPSKENLSKPIVAIFFASLILSAFIAELIGIHALFGAFLAGAIMPESVRFRILFVEKIEDVAIVLLLPLFFVFTGLRTQIGLIDDPEIWKATAIVILVAILGKLVGTAVIAKIFDQNLKDSLILGTLLNTRGLMVLIILNIGYDLGVFPSEIFTMMVLMALATTLMTSPVLSLIDKLFRSSTSHTTDALRKNSKYNILISFANPEMGKSLLRLAHSLVRKLHDNASVTVMHLAPSSEIHQYNAQLYEKGVFGVVLDESRYLNQKISTLFKSSGDIITEITEIANKGKYDLLLIGIGKSIFDGNPLGKMLGFTTRLISPDRIFNQVMGRESLFGHHYFDPKTEAILSKSNISVGILIDKGLSEINLVVVPILCDSDMLILKFVQKLIWNTNSQVTFIDPLDVIENYNHLKESITRIEQIAPNHIRIIKSNNAYDDIFENQNLMIISVSSWKKAIDQKSSWLKTIPSTLIISK